MKAKKNVTTSPVESNPATVAVPEPLLIDLLIDHLLVDHILTGQPVDTQPERVLELLADHLLDIPISRDVAIPVEWAIDHLLEHLAGIEAAMGKTAVARD